MNEETETKPFNYYNNYYDLLYHNKDYKNESDYVARLIRSITPQAENIIELGSGTGNYATFLCQQGFKVTGIEFSQQMSAIAETKNIKGFTTITNDVTEFDLEQHFDAAVALFHVISYLTSNEKVVQCFKKVNKHLKPNSLFIFDVWYTPAVYIQSPQQRVKEISNGNFHISRVAIPMINYDDNTVQVNYEMSIHQIAENKTEILKEAHTLRHFSTPEIKLFAQLAGFKFIHAEEFLTEKAPGADTWGVCYILQKHE
ncbi:MAG TPA: class I SAM-dependent methyltransferase [Segetibacter sp.]|jgi:SAM-dependent methyltransferase